MQISWRLATTLTAMTLLVGLIPAARAANDCQAKVTFDSVTSEGKNVLATFKVKTTCAASTGRFAYSYESSAKPGKTVTRNHPTWNAADGKEFMLKDRIPESDGATVSNIKVVKDSIESTKL